MEIPFDLSTVTFIATANSIEGVNEALLDRFEKVQLRGYSPEEEGSDGLEPPVTQTL